MSHQVYRTKRGQANIFNTQNFCILSKKLYKGNGCTYLCFPYPQIGRYLCFLFFLFNVLFNDWKKYTKTAELLYRPMSVIVIEYLVTSVNHGKSDLNFLEMQQQVKQTSPISQLNLLIIILDKKCKQRFINDWSWILEFAKTVSTYYYQHILWLYKITMLLFLTRQYRPDVMENCNNKHHI